jgi:hypothetical protein
MPPLALPRLRWPRLRRLPALHPVAWAGIVLAVLLAGDVAYQVARKPTELLGLVAPTRPRAAEDTWAAYRPIFDAHSTRLVRAELLAALAQVESGGDPLARTYWRWRLAWNPLEIYAPASSAVGLLQITDGTFEQAQKLCIHDHEVARDGPWHAPSSCWFNALYFRTVPSHAVEMTAAILHEGIVRILSDPQVRAPGPEQVDRLAAVIHLCGPERGVAYARRAFRTLPGERCGDHDLADYLARVERLARGFGRGEG